LVASLQHELLTPVTQSNVSFLQLGLMKCREASLWSWSYLKHLLLLCVPFCPEPPQAPAAPFAKVFSTAEDF
jgi:hypothetical protein